MAVAGTPDPSTLLVGTRIAQGAHRGTIRFVGEVPPTQGSWLGVEWDDAIRGKHDGTHNDKRYFACRNVSSKTAASFIRPNARRLAYGSSFLSALRHKYVGAEEQHDSESSLRRYTRKNLADIAVEAPNMEGVRQRMAQLDRLRDVGLGGWTMERDPEAEENDAVLSEAEEQIQVARAIDADSGESTGDITRTCPNIRWLDLSRSLLPTWAEVAKITSELPLLDTLALHFNRFAALTVDDRAIHVDAFRALKDLRLDRTLITWSEMCLLSASMPALESLQLGANQLEALQSFAAADVPFPALRQLNLADNELSDWTGLLSLLAWQCPQLERLIVSGNRFTVIPPPSSAVAPPLLRHVSLADNALSSWSDVDNLSAWIPVLKGLVVSPELCSFGSHHRDGDDDARSTRLLIIARSSSSLEVLSQARITGAERRDAELYYISTVERETAGMPDTQRNALHPRYAVLSVQHGSTTKSFQSDSSAPDVASTATTTLRSKLLSVRIHASATPPSSTPPYVVATAHDAIEVMLLTSTPLRLLQGKIARSLGIAGGAKSIRSIWALLSAHIDPQQATAIQLRREMRPSESIASASEERIVYALDNLDWDLSGYNFSLGDELVVVVSK